MDYVTSVDHRVSDIEQHFKKLIILQRNTELSFQNLHLEMKEFKDEMKEFKDEMYLDRKSLNKKWGDLANKMGTIIEDIVSPNIPSIAKKYFNCDEIDHLMIRNYKRSPDKSKGKEFDLIAVCGDKVIFNNTKSSPSAQYIAEFIEELKNNVLFEYFPELSDK